MASGDVVEGGRLPTDPMTPEKAERYGDWWKRAGAALGLLAFVVALFGINGMSFIIMIAASLCFMEARSCYGWAGGYRVRDRRQGHERL